MKRILAISGSRADYGLLEWPVKVLRERFEVEFVRGNWIDPANAWTAADATLRFYKPDCLLILGDRWEILQAAIAAHLQRIPIAHIGGGDTSLGSYDDQMRDAISVLAKYHFTTSPQAEERLAQLLQYQMIYMIGNIAIDYIRHGDWKRERPADETDPYVVVSYQAETIDGRIDWDAVVAAIGGRDAYFLRPNADAGSDKIIALIDDYTQGAYAAMLDDMPHPEFLNLLYHCECFIGNSSAIFYECPELGVKTQLIGKRQQGRVIPTGDGKASERIRDVLLRAL